MEIETEGIEEWLRPSFEKLKLCPLCLKETAVHQTLWGYSLIDACARHGCDLLSNCTACGKAFIWTKLNINWTCLCGQAVALTVPTNSSPNNLTLARFFCETLRNALSLEQQQTMTLFPVNIRAMTAAL